MTATSSTASAGPIYRLGDFVARDPVSRARDRAAARGSDDQRSSRRCLLAHRPAAEARYQWRRALQFGPEADEVKSIETKLDHGLAQAAAGGCAAAEPRVDAMPRGRAARRPSSISICMSPAGAADGYHLLDSLVAFADIADGSPRRRRRACRSTSPGRSPPRSPAPVDDNLVWRAALAAGARISAARPAAALTLDQEPAGRHRASAAARAMPRRRCGRWPALWRRALGDGALARDRRDARRRCAGLPARAHRLARRHRRARSSRRRRCRRSAWCWSIPASRWRPPAVFKAPRGAFSRAGALRRGAGAMPPQLAALLPRGATISPTPAIGMVPAIAAVLARLEALPTARCSRA